jgi:hypothetical protein
MNNNKKQTALEWLIGQLHKTRDWQRVINEANQSSTSVRDVIDEAKEMEKEQKIFDYSTGWHDGQDIILNQIKHLEIGGDAAGEKHCNETYGGNK